MNQSKGLELPKCIIEHGSHDVELAQLILDATAVVQPVDQKEQLLLHATFRALQ